MTDSITPPPELVQQLYGLPQLRAIEKAYQAGADQERKACLANIHTMYGKDKADWLRSMRRPKPPSLKEQAQVELDRLIALIPTEGAIAMAEPIRRALEALPE
jgi:hypothetical protein